MKTALTIAGSDSSGGAGIQADIKTMSALGVYAESVVTALTAQNTMGVQGVVATDPDFVLLQMKSVFSDICPNAVKIGMLPTAEVVHAVGQGLQRFDAQNVVLDPVMVATSGGCAFGGACSASAFRFACAGFRGNAKHPRSRSAFRHAHRN